jgi:hypothetical protein
MPNATKKATTPGKKTPPRKKAANASVRIRMYRPGLGDCWLLTFPHAGKENHILIDCGVFIGTPGQRDRLNDIASHIRKTTGNRVNALVATHEHWDHVAGFFFAQDQFRELKPDEVWAAWTEDPDQTIATENKKKTNAMAAAVGMAVTRMMNAESAYDRECGAAAAKVMDFSGALGAANFSERSDQAMQFVTNQRKPGDRFLEPGDVLERDWIPGGLRVYVLAPPKDRDALRQDRTPHEEGFKDEKDNKSRNSKDGAASAWAAALLGASGENTPTGELAATADRARPFDISLAWPEEEMFKQSASTATASDPIWPLTRRYRDEPWRRIDNDWLHSAASLALQLDNSINNTSLVLAIELVASGKVLLFVGDSELESWKSWQNRVFQLRNGARVTAGDLLARTVFYKVGHHGSGNATLRAGLARMTSPELVAAVPTDTEFASTKQGWDMPAAKLVPALAAQAKGRVLYADPGKSCVRESNPAGLSPQTWKQFVDAVDEADPLCVDYHLRIP